MKICSKGHQSDGGRSHLCRVRNVPHSFFQIPLSNEVRDKLSLVKSSTRKIPQHVSFSFWDTLYIQIQSENQSVY